MIRAFTPRDSGGYSWVLLAVVLLVGVHPHLVRSQEPKAAKPAAGAAQPAADPAQAAAPPTSTIEVYRDPRVQQYLPNTFPQLGRNGPASLRNSVMTMAGGGAPTDRAALERFVNSRIATLTDHGNIRAIIDSENPAPAGASSNYAIRDATNDLLDPLLTARTMAPPNTGFLTTYNQVLLQLLPPLLEAHLLTRIEASIVLSQTATPDALDLFVKQLSDPNQTVWVALWAARGLTNIQVANKYNLDTSRAIRAAKVVSDFLVREKKNNLPWPVQYRALEALGALRQPATVRPEKGQPEMATTATQFLTDAEAKLEVRAEAAWALGMMQVPAGFAGYNFTLLAYTLGDIAATLGERVHESYPKNAIQAEAWTGILVMQVLQALNGVDGARESGLLNSSHPAAVQARGFIKQVSDKTRPIAASSVRLLKGGAGQAPGFLKELDAKVADLKGWLQKNPPPNAWLVPNGPNFPVAPGGGRQVANAPAGDKVVNGPAGRKP